MAVIFVLPSDQIDEELTQLLSGRVRSYFGALIQAVHSAGPVATHYASTCGVPNIAPLENIRPHPGDIIVTVNEANGSTPALPESCEGPFENYVCDRMGRIFSCKSEISALEYPQIEAHVFNRLGPRGPNNTFYYYPYGYLFRDNSVGHIDSMGFRVLDDLSHLENRPAGHKLAVVFGGSAAFSMYSGLDEMFSTVTEGLINDSLKASGDGQNRITVLNYGMHGNVMINQILSWILYCRKLNPDVVIAHDGWNDFAYGLMSDPHLLDKWQLTYQYNLENWSQLIHATFDKLVNQPDAVFEPFNLPFSVLRAYMDRKRQFAELVKGRGAKFIWALQPCIYNKASLSLKEKDRTNLSAHGMHSFAKVYSRTKILYDAFVDSLRNDPPENFVDFPAIFSRYDESVTLFADHVHTVPLGDRVIANVYAELLTPMLFDVPYANRR